MKVIIILLASLSLSISAFSQKLVKTYYDRYNTKIQSEYYTDAYGEKVGTFKGYSEYGGILLQGSYKDGAPIGKWTENYLDGKLHFIRIFDTPGNGLKVVNGKIISYYEDGKTIEVEKNLKNGDYDGVYKEYDKNGTLTLEGIYVNGVFQRTGESKRIYDEQQEKKKALQKEQEAATLLINTEKYNKIIPEADKANEVNDYKKALELYQAASQLLGNEKYPKDKISEIIGKLEINSKFIYEYAKTESNTLVNDFNTLKADFKIKSVKAYSSSTYTYYDKVPKGLYAKYDCVEPWNYEYANLALGCFVEMNKEFYEPYQIAATTAYFYYGDSLKKGINNANNLYIRFNFENKEYKFTTYDKTTFLNNLKVAKENFELSKSFKTYYLKAIESNTNITNLNGQNKKNTLFKKYLIVYTDLIAKINAYPGLVEATALLKSLNAVSDKVVALYSQETKDLEKKLKDAETTEQIQTIILGQ
jgi:hypothetical protein